MHNVGNHPGGFVLREHGIRNLASAYWNLPPAQLIEKALERREGMLASNGGLVVRTGQFTGRSPKDKFIVRQAETESAIDWGPVNQPMSEANFDRLHSHVLAFLQGREVYVQDCFGGAAENYRLPVRVITVRAWHSLFARQLFVRPRPARPATIRNLRCSLSPITRRIRRPTARDPRPALRSISASGWSSSRARSTPGR